jgi:hypothetical protein
MENPLIDALSYIPGTRSSVRAPLWQFLPPIPDGVISTWLRQNVSQGSWILDPFCASPRIAIEAARAGYRVLVTANNPITRFILEFSATPPSTDVLKAVLAELASSYKADERIEPHIRSLYNTRCARCGQIVSADAFIWEHDNPSPYMRIYTCPSCGDTGEHACTPFDSERSGQFVNVGLHKARALERVVASNDQDRIHVEQALSVYPPRAIYALVTIINKIEGLEITAQQKRYLSALLLYALDQSNSMIKPSGLPERRRQLTIPRHFRENNVWLVLEQAIEAWSGTLNTSDQSSAPLTMWPEQPPDSGGICIYEGRLLSIVGSLAELNIKSVCAAIPRPNQAFWTLSALWAGWLWGREAVGSIKSVLHRQRYDWAWHTTALFSIFKQLVHVLDPSTKILGLIGESEPGFIAAALVAARIAGCGLEGIALRAEEEQAQIVWKCKEERVQLQNDISLINVGEWAARNYLQERGEPTSYFNTIVSAFVQIIQKWEPGQLQTTNEKKNIDDSQQKADEPSGQNEPNPSLAYSTIYNSAREALSYRGGFLRYNLQDLLESEVINRVQSAQASLFPLEPGNISSDEGDLDLAGQSALEGETVAEKERPTRSSDITESTYLWLREIDRINKNPISDRYENILLDLFSEHPGYTLESLDSALCQSFPGLFTPDPEIIHLFLESYGEENPSESGSWCLRAEDIQEERQRDIEDAFFNLQLIATRLGIQSRIDLENHKKFSISWIDAHGELNYHFFPITTASLGEKVIYYNPSSIRNFIVLPGSRANLVIYKLKRDPRLNRAFNPAQGNWRILKFRHLRSLAENPLLNRENFEQLIALDPITYTTPQLRLI